MDLLHLVDRLEELVANAQKMPIGSRAIIDRRRLLDIVDQMRVAIPAEVREAQDMVARRDDFQRQAEEEGRLIVAQAEERAARLVDEHEIVGAARHRAEELANQGETRLEERIREANADIESRIIESRRLAEQQMGAADEYAHELLVRLERQLQAFVRSVQSGIDQLDPENTGATGISAAEAVERFASHNDAARPSEVGGQGESDESSRAAAEVEYTEQAAAAPAGALGTLMGRRNDAEDIADDEYDEPSEPAGDGELENLLERRFSPESMQAAARDIEPRALRPPPPETEQVPPAEDGVIDDFAIPQLDDEPEGADVSTSPASISDLWPRRRDPADDEGDR